ncbi:unnamed protein product, partial [Candidula unifasciata]
SSVSSPVGHNQNWSGCNSHCSCRCWSAVSSACFVLMAVNISDHMPVDCFSGYNAGCLVPAGLSS